MPHGEEPVKVSRDIEVVQIPDGHGVRLARGTMVRLMQSLGGTFTVMTDYGNMVRVAAKDADAIGQTVASNSSAQVVAPKTSDEVEKLVWQQLRSVYDPEIPVNVVDLGLVYRCEIKALQPEGFSVYTEMTLTAPGCGMGDVLQEDARSRIAASPGIKETNVHLVLDPPWNQGMMSEAAKLELGLA